MPINMQIEYPKLEAENIRLRQQNTELIEACNKLPMWLRRAAESLEIQANKAGMTNALTPKLNWYADKIENTLPK